MRRGMFLSLWVLSFALISTFAEEMRFQVKHDHGLRSCRGELAFRDESVEYLTSYKDDARPGTT